MGFFSKFEGKMEDTFEGAVDRMANSPISPVQIAKKAEKQMRREKMVGAGKQFAPTLYTVLVNPDDDQRLFGYYPTLAGETETYLAAKAAEQGLVMDGQPLVRFIVDEDLKHGKFDVIAEAVAAPIVSQLRDEEMYRYGLGGAPQAGARGGYGAPQGGRPGAYGGRPDAFAGYPQQAPAPAPAPAYGYDQGYDGYAEPAYDAPGLYDDYGQGQGGGDGYAFDDGHAGPAGRHVVDPFDVANASMAAAGAGAAASAHAVPPAASAAPQRVAADTVVFSGGGQPGAAAVPSRSAVRARLVDTASNRSYDLAGTRLLIGRESKNDISIQDINASRTHAELRFEPQGVWSLTDLGSTNGTFVNGREIGTQLLREGDHITIGMTNLVFDRA